MKRKWLFIALLAILLLTGGLVFTNLKAQKGPAGMRVHPSNFDLSLTPGEPLTGTVYVDNLTNVSLPVQVGIKNFTAQGEEGGVSLTTEDTTYALAKWIKITPTSVNLPAGSSQKFTYTITPPKNAEPGGHFGSLVFATVPNSKLQGSGAGISQQVASLILARIPGDVKEQASVETFAPEKNFYENGPVNFNIRVKNEGGVHIRPSGEIKVTDIFGNKTYIPFQGLNVLPGAIRKMPGEFKQKFLIGKYSVSLLAAYGQKNEQLSAYTEFTGFPIKYGLIALVILILLILFRGRLFRAISVILRGK